jgi:hypothetical protein
VPAAIGEDGNGKSARVTRRFTKRQPLGEKVKGSG